MEHLPEYINYWNEVGLSKFIRVFWYFVVFELFRYIVIDFIILFLFTRNKEKRAKKWQQARTLLLLDNPFVSVIVPGKNEGKHLFKLTTSLQEQSYQNFELIIVDDGSDDQTELIGKSLEKNGKIDLFLRNEQRGGKASAANLALQFSKGKYIVHLDADCSFDCDAIENILIPFYLDTKIKAVGGNVKVRDYEGNLCSTLQAIEYLKTVSVGRIVTSYLGIYKIISGAFGAFEAKAIHAIKGWDIGPGLDGDITVKIRKSGHKVVFSHKAIGFTSVPNTFKKLTKQRLRWDKSIVRFRMRKHIDVFHPNANFRWTNFFAISENLFYNIVLNICWWLYIIDIIYNYNSSLKFIIPMNLTLYIVCNYAQMIAINCFSERKKEATRLWKFAWLMPIYTGLYLRLVRSYAYFREYFFKASYEDLWNPTKSSRKAREFGM